jgi:GNAT superfamily N-acetyltransferase
MTTFFGALDANRKKHVDPTKDYFMHILCVSPSHHRQGIGGLILKHVLDQCDREGAKCYIEASAAGLPLYLRMGWEVVDQIQVDMEANGAEGGVIYQKCLWRVPREV